MSPRNEDIAGILGQKLANNLGIGHDFSILTILQKEIGQPGEYPFPVTGNGYCLPELIEIQYNGIIPRGASL